MTQTYFGHTGEEVVQALEVWDRSRKPKDEALAGLKRLRDGGILDFNPREKEDVTSGMICIAELLTENERLRREREDLRMFCKGMARNIEGMLKT